MDSVPLCADAAIGRAQQGTNADVVICTMGTLGDILPFLSIAAELKKRGHPVTILTNANWQAQVLSTGVRFLPIAPEDPAQSGRNDYAFFLEQMLPAFNAMMELAESAVRSERRQLFVYRTNMLGMECAAEKFAVPHVKVALQPSAIRSFDRPPWPLTRFAEGRLRHLFRWIIVPGLFLASDLAGPYRRHANAFRKSHGLAPYGWGVTAPRTEDLTIVMTPDWFALPQRDWPANAHCVGFPFAQATPPVDPVDQHAHDAIAAEQPSIVFTPGTGVTDIAAFLHLAEQLCDAVAMPGLLVSRAVTRPERSGRLTCRPYVDLGTALKKAKLLVHHGGIGTTAQALRAGVPQLILPNRFDQPDNAARIATLRLGGVVFDRADIFDTVRLTRRLLEDSEIRINVRAAAEAISRQKAEVEAVDLIQRVVGRRT